MSIMDSNKTPCNLNEEKSLRKSKYIICPECKENARIMIDNYTFGVYNCKNGHKIDNILIKDFEESQYYEESKIKCQNCNIENKNISSKKIFYICCDCKKIICSFCRFEHDKTHKINNYEEKHFICNLHYESYKSYCQDCQKDICLSCELEHNEHKTISYGAILPKIENIKEERNDFYNKKEELKSEIQNIIDNLKTFMDTIDNYFAIYEDLIYNYGNQKRNIQFYKI